MVSTKNLIQFLLIAAITVTGGWVHGRLSNRWTAAAAAEVGEKVTQIPDSFASWELKSSETLDQDSLSQLECVGHICRVYQDRFTGELVKVILIVGPVGPTAAHTPEVCFSSRAFMASDRRRRVEIQDAAGAHHQFWKMTFSANSLDKELLGVCWAWSSGGTWKSPEAARLSYAGYPYLYKLQLSGLLQRGQVKEGSDICSRFLRDFLPVAAPYLEEPQG